MAGLGNPNWTPGQSGNPNGRPPGTRNKKTARIFQALEARGDKDPAEFLSSIVTDEKEPKDLRVRCADALLPYKYGKMGTIPAPRFVADPIEVPTFQSIDQAEDYLAEIPQRVGRGELDFQSALDFSNMVRNWIEAKLAHTNTDLKVQAQGGGDATIHITGGLPSLPGTTIIMDDTAVGSRAINGHPGPSIEHQAAEAEHVTVPLHGSVEPPKDPSEGLSD
jgi:hypothetical protein